jgi:hypothetical protein
MGRSSLLGVERATPEPIGRDVASLGPSDSSDSGSDMAGLDALDRLDPTEPVDTALATDVPRTWMPVDAPEGATADASGTGERRAAGNDAGLREAADISVDRVFDPTEEGEPSDDEDPDLAFVDEVEAEAVLDDEDGEDDADPSPAARQALAEDAAPAADPAPARGKPRGSPRRGAA